MSDFTHKRKRTSYAASFKLKAVEAAKKTSNVEAAKKFGVDESNIRRWKKDSSLDSIPNSKRAKRGPKTGQLPEMEKDILEWFDAQRQNGYSVSRLALRLQALQLAKSGKYQGASTFTAFKGWCTRFLSRNGISLRIRTKIAQKLPSEFQEKMMNFQSYMINQRKTYETPICFDMPSNQTLHKKGDKTVLIKTTGHEKTHFTVVLSCTADGSKLPPMIIFKRKKPPKDKFPSGVIIHQHPKGWMDKAGVIKWINMVWVRRNGGLLKKRSMLVWDQFRAHLTDEVKRSLKESNIISTVIPGGLTGMLQPLDVSLSRPFKTHMRKQWTLWMADGMAERTAKGNFKRPPLPTVASWVKNAWDMISKEMIKKIFFEMLHQQCFRWY